MFRLFIFALSFLGLVAGVILAFLTKEELLPGEKYFKLLEKVLLLIIGVVIISYVADFFSFFFIGLVLGVFFRRLYAYAGVLAAIESKEFLLLVSSLVFLLGLPHGTLIVKNLLKNERIFRELLFSAGFFLGGLIVFWVFGCHPLLMLAAGAFIVSSIRPPEKFGSFRIF